MDFWLTILSTSLAIVLGLFIFTIALLGLLWVVMALETWIDARKRKRLRKEHVRAVQEYLQRRSFDV